MLKRISLVSLVVIILDQISKTLILVLFQRGEVLPVIPGFFNLTLHFNPGAAFGMFKDLSPGLRSTLLSLTTILALGFVAYLLFKEYRFDKWGQVTLAMILGGALGNVIDRLRLGEVVDFLDFYLGSYHWPAFNVADSSICVAVIFLVVYRPKKT